jgi:pimeloyl-ACP methyl ester carboxylesterase
MPLLIWAALIVLFGLAAGASYQALGTRRDRRNHPPPGRLVDVGTHRLHLLESGRGNGPTVVFESGLMSTVLSWKEIADDLSRSFHIVRYDRAGLGWSDRGPMPRTAEQIAQELHALLERSAVPPPYILVGHSFGGLTMPVFAKRFPQVVAGMVLLDAVAPSEWSPPPERDRKLVSTGAKVCRRASLLARFGLLRLVAFLLTTRAKTLAARVVRLMSRGAPEDSGTVSSPWFSALPPQEKEMARVFWLQPKFALTIASQLENLPRSAQAAAAAAIFCDKPVVILSAASASEKRREAHAKIAALLPNAVHSVAKSSAHWIMQDEPELVASAIESVYQANLRVAHRPSGLKDWQEMRGQEWSFGTDRRTGPGSASEPPDRTAKQQQCASEPPG